MVGLFGNMCCVKEVRDELAKQEEMQETLLELLTCPDSPTLIQLVRLFQSITWDLIKSDGQSFTSTDQHWFEKQMGNAQFPLSLSFILSSSTCGKCIKNSIHKFFDIEHQHGLSSNIRLTLSSICYFKLTIH